MDDMKELNEILTEAGTLLDKAAQRISDIGLDSKENIKKIGEALMNIFEIRMQIFAKRPDLTPDYLKEIH